MKLTPENQRLVVMSVAIAALITSMVIAVPTAQQSLLPAEEGLIAGVYGWQPDLHTSKVYSSKNIPTKPSNDVDGWELVSDDPNNYKIGYWEQWTERVFYNFYERTTAQIEVGRPYYEHFEDISYELENGKDSKGNPLYTRVDGDVWVYHMDVDFSILAKDHPDAGIHVFENVPVWLSFTTNTWNRAIQDQAGNKGTAWGAPIAAYIEGYSVDSRGGTHNAIAPSYIGRAIPLYSTPSSVGFTIDDLGIMTDMHSVNIENSLSPDTRMKSTAFAKFTMEDFGIESTYQLGGVDGQRFPAVNYKIKVYFLSVGKWTFTKDQAEDWQNREADVRNYGFSAAAIWAWDSITGIVGFLNPFRAFGAWGGIVAMGCLVLLIGAGVFILLYGTPIGQMILVNFNSDRNRRGRGE